MDCNKGGGGKVKLWKESTFSPKKGREVVKIVEDRRRLLRESNLCLLLVFVFINPKSLQFKVYTTVTSFNKYVP